MHHQLMSVNKIYLIPITLLNLNVIIVGKNM